MFFFFFLSSAYFFSLVLFFLWNTYYVLLCISAVCSHVYLPLSLLFFFSVQPQKKKHVFSSPWVRKWCLLCVFLTLYQLEFKMKKKKKERETKWCFSQFVIGWRAPRRWSCLVMKKLAVWMHVTVASLRHTRVMEKSTQRSFFFFLFEETSIPYFSSFHCVVVLSSLLLF